MRRIAFVLIFAGTLPAADRDVADWVIRQGGNVTIEGRAEVIHS
jgi:hypothetical protein